MNKDELKALREMIETLQMNYIHIWIMQAISIVTLLIVLLTILKLQNTIA